MTSRVVCEHGKIMNDTCLMDIWECWPGIGFIMVSFSITLLILTGSILPRELEGRNRRVGKKGSCTALDKGSHSYLVRGDITLSYCLHFLGHYLKLSCVQFLTIILKFQIP